MRERVAQFHSRIQPSTAQDGEDTLTERAVMMRTDQFDTAHHLSLSASSSPSSSFRFSSPAFSSFSSRLASRFTSCRLCAFISLTLLTVLLLRSSFHFGWHLRDEGVAGADMSSSHGGSRVDYGISLLPGGSESSLVWLMEDWVRRMWGPMPKWDFDQLIPIHASNQYEGERLPVMTDNNKQQRLIVTSAVHGNDDEQQHQHQQHQPSSPSSTLSDPHRSRNRPHGVLTWLVRNSDEGLRELSHSIGRVHRYWNGCTRYPVIVWVEEGMNREETTKFHDKIVEMHQQVVNREKDGKNEEEWKAASSSNLACSHQQDASLWPPIPAHQCYPMYHCISGNIQLHAWYDEESDETARAYGRVRDAPLPWESGLCRRVSLASDVCLPWTLIIGEVQFDQRGAMPNPPQPVHGQEEAVKRNKDGTRFGIEDDDSEFGEAGRFLQVDYSEPIHQEGKEGCRPTRLSYRHMARMQTFVQYHPLLAGFEYYMRLDDDGELMTTMPYDPFTLMQKTGKEIGWVLADAEYAGCETQLSTHLRFYRDALRRGVQLQQPPYTPPPSSMYGKDIRRYLLDHEEEWNLDRAIARNEADRSDPKHKAPISPSSLVTGSDLWHEQVVYYLATNFEVGRLAFWRDSRVRRFLHYIDRSHGTYRWRWGDAPIRSAAIQLFMPTKRITYLADVRYKHRMQFNYPERLLEKKVWRFLHSLPFHNFVSFHVFSLIAIPFFVLAALVVAMIQTYRLITQLRPVLARAVGTARRMYDKLPLMRHTLTTNAAEVVVVEDNESHSDNDQADDAHVVSGVVRKRSAADRFLSHAPIHTHVLQSTPSDPRSVGASSIPTSALAVWLRWFRVFILVVLTFSIALDRLSLYNYDLILPRVIMVYQDLCRFAWPACLLAVGVMVNKGKRSHEGAAVAETEKERDIDTETEAESDTNTDMDMDIGRRIGVGVETRPFWHWRRWRAAVSIRRATIRRAVLILLYAFIPVAILFVLLRSMLSHDMVKYGLRSEEVLDSWMWLDHQSIAYLLVALAIVSLLSFPLRRTPAWIVHILALLALSASRTIIEESAQVDPHDYDKFYGYRGGSGAMVLLGNIPFFSMYKATESFSQGWTLIWRAIICSAAPFLVGWLLGFYVALAPRPLCLLPAFVSSRQRQSHLYQRARSHSNVDDDTDVELDVEGKAKNQKDTALSGDVDADDGYASGSYAYASEKDSGDEASQSNNGRQHQHQHRSITVTSAPPSTTLRRTMILPFGRTLPIHRLPPVMHRLLSRCLDLGDGDLLVCFHVLLVCCYRSIRHLLTLPLHYRYSILLYLTAMTIVSLIAAQNIDFVWGVSVEAHGRDWEILPARKRIIAPIAWRMMGIVAILAYTIATNCTYSYKQQQQQQPQPPSTSHGKQRRRQSRAHSSAADENEHENSYEYDADRMEMEIDAAQCDETRLSGGVGGGVRMRMQHLTKWIRIPCRYSSSLILRHIHSVVDWLNHYWCPLLILQCCVTYHLTRTAIFLPSGHPATGLPAHPPSIWRDITPFISLPMLTATSITCAAIMVRIATMIVKRCMKRFDGSAQNHTQTHARTKEMQS